MHQIIFHPGGFDEAESRGSAMKNYIALNSDVTNFDFRNNLCSIIVSRPLQAYSASSLLPRRSLALALLFSPSGALLKDVFQAVFDMMGQSLLIEK